jgi:hypothetical protein
MLSHKTTSKNSFEGADVLNENVSSLRKIFSFLNGILKLHFFDKLLKRYMPQELTF